MEKRLKILKIIYRVLFFATLICTIPIVAVPVISWLFKDIAASIMTFIVLSILTLLLMFLCFFCEYQAYNSLTNIMVDQTAKKTKTVRIVLAVVDVLIVLLYAAIYFYVVIPAVLSGVFHIPLGKSVISAELLLTVIAILLLVSLPLSGVLSLVETILFAIDGAPRPRWQLKNPFSKSKLDE